MKAAAARDVGSRDTKFLTCVAAIRENLLHLAHAPPLDYSSVLVPGSGTSGIESVLCSSVNPRTDRLLIAVNGAYGERMATIARGWGMPHVVLRKSERRPITAADVRTALSKAGPGISHVAVVHHETTAGVLNPVADIGAAIAAGVDAGAPAPALIVDSMSAFGAYPLNLPAARVAFVISSANKCIEGLPGFSFVVAERRALMRCAGVSPSLSLDLHAQWSGLERNGQFRFTPPTQSLLAFRAALEEHAAEGGVSGRLARYAANFELLRADMAELGFKLYVEGDSAGCIISTFLWPDDPRFNFDSFYEGLGARGLVIYPGKLTRDNCFRIGTIGHLFPRDVRRLTVAVREVLLDMGVSLPVRQVQAQPEPEIMFEASTKKQA